MTALNRHRILRQVLELDVASMAGVPAIQETVAAQFRDQTLPELEALFDRLAGPDEILSLDRLEVNLGNLSGPGWQEQFHARLLEQMRQSLEQASRPGGDSPPWEPSPSTGAHTPFRQWLFYLARGRLPWWGGEPGPDWPETLCGELDSGQREALTRLLRSDAKARLRLIHSASDGLLGRLAETLGGLPEAARVMSVLSPEGQPDESARHWRQQFWMTLLAWAHEIPPQIETGALLLQRLLEQRDAIARPNAGFDQDGQTAWRPKADHADEVGPPSANAVDLSSAKPSPAGKPSPEGEGVGVVVKSTALTLPAPWRQWFEQAAAKQEEQPARSPDNAQQSETSRWAPPDVPFQQLLFYLAHGHLPSGGGEPDPGWPETLGEQPDGRAWKTLGDLLHSNAMARLRLVHAVSDGFLARLAETLAGLPQADRVLGLLAPAGLSAESARYWRQQFWMTLLAWVPEDPPITAGARLLLRLLEQRDAVAMPGSRIGLPARWPGDDNAANLSSAKPSPEGQIRRGRIWSRGERPQGSGQDSPETLGWVTTAWMQEVEQRREQLPRGSNREKSLFKSPHHPSSFDKPVLSGSRRTQDRHFNSAQSRPFDAAQDRPFDEAQGRLLPEGEGVGAVKSTTLPLPEPWQHWLETAASQNADIVRQETGGPFHGESTTPASAEFPQPSTGAPEQNPSTGALPPEDADLPFQRLLFFLAHGRLPAWGGNAVDLSSIKPSPEGEGVRGLKSTALNRDGEPETNWMDALGQQLHAGQWQILAERLHGDYRAGLRLVPCVGDGFLETLVETVAGLPEAARVLGLLSPAELSRESRLRWRQQFWMTLLEWLAVGPDLPRNGERLLQRLLEQRAAVAAVTPEFNWDAVNSHPLTRDHNFVDIMNPSEQDRVSAKPSPEGEGVHVLDSTAPSLPEPWRQWFEVAAQRNQAEEYERDPAAPANYPPDIAGEFPFRPPPLQEGEAIYLRGAGAVILHPFIEELFRSRELLEGRAFRDEAARRRAVRLLGYLAFGTEDTPEYELLLPKLLCGMDWEEPLPPAGLTGEECECCDELLRAVLKHWSVLKCGSPEWLREQFFLREGKLERLEENWKLAVERRIQDVLLDRLPWGIGLIQLPWMDGFLHVSWVE